jgi:hypothetical protein
MHYTQLRTTGFNAKNEHLLVTAIQVRGGFEQDPQVFEGVHTFNNVTFKQKLLTWVNEIEHHDFCFFHVTISPRLAQNCLSMFNCCYSPTSDSDVRVKSSTKSNNHTCMSIRVGALHSLPSKCPFRASKYSPNSMRLKGQPCFTPC